MACLNARRDAHLAAFLPSLRVSMVWDNVTVLGEFLAADAHLPSRSAMFLNSFAFRWAIVALR